MSLSLNQKLRLTSRNGMLTLFLSDNGFVKAYNQSAFYLSKLIGRNFSPLVIKSKYPPYQQIIMVSFPKSHLLQYLPNLIITSYGYEQLIDLSLKGYGKWMSEQISNLNLPNGFL